MFYDMIKFNCTHAGWKTAREKRPAKREILNNVVTPENYEELRRLAEDMSTWLC